MSAKDVAALSLRSLISCIPQEQSRIGDVGRRNWWRILVQWNTMITARNTVQELKVDIILDYCPSEIVCSSSALNTTYFFQIYFMLIGVFFQSLVVLLKPT
jgi:hypothetical protein